MKALVQLAAAVLLMVITASKAYGQPNCGALIQPGCLAKFGAGADIAPNSDCGRQLDEYRNCIAATAALQPESGGDRAGPLDADSVADLRELFKAAVYHYDRHSGRFERRVLTGGTKTPDLLNIYRSKGIIYYYGKSDLSLRATADRLHRSQVAEEYLRVMTRIFRDNETWRARRSAFAKEAKSLQR